MPQRIHNSHKDQLELIFYTAFIAHLQHWGGLIGPDLDPNYCTMNTTDQLDARYKISDQFIMVQRKYVYKRYMEVCETEQSKIKLDEIGSVFGFKYDTKHIEPNNLMYLKGTAEKRLTYTIRVAMSNLFGDPIYPDKCFSIDSSVYDMFHSKLILKACRETGIEKPSSLEFFNLSEDNSKLDKLKLEFNNLVAFYAALPTVEDREE
ncbi:uncharacterized protein SPAPADRAFT_49132 [Spathaspora passalidarum NRRL Y-27907]|uniref:Uncharacterized protein n=1 Tax=Spathaspora passalidarum (strain NRRL Y-27907 / 11-Y1) TaxID=619300 RepID=G3AK01_SPAPN|nr:uncharacterized protein SPAPADRAFT_49132 [Spathaspora passalidarum NRRL Y-27907]EGW34052.1 hypothetical protein SPAPADRAFT_49132 [Spathaspora passalidarum NRRL Y-27907]